MTRPLHTIPWLAILLAACACSHRPTEKVYHPIGLQAGFNFASAQVGDLELQRKRRVVWGQNFELELNDYFAYRQEHWLARKGGVAPAGETLLGVPLLSTSTYELDYIQIDSLLKIRFDTWGIKPYLLGGPFLGLNFGRSITGPGAPQIQERDVELGVGVGAGFEIDIFKQVAVLLEGRYSMGLTSAIGGQDWKSRAIQIIMGVEFNLRPDRDRMKRARRYIGHYREFKDIDEPALK